MASSAILQKFAEEIQDQLMEVEMQKNKHLHMMALSDAIIAKLERQNVIMREALTWYADKQSWAFMEIHEDEGCRAREALEKAGK